MFLTIITLNVNEVILTIFCYCYFHVGLTLFQVPILSRKTVKRDMKTKPKYKHTMKNKLQACKRTRGFRCRLNCAVSVGHGADGGLDFGDVASFVAVLSQRSSRGCVPSAVGHTFSDF